MNKLGSFLTLAVLAAGAGAGGYSAGQQDLSVSDVVQMIETAIGPPLDAEPMPTTADAAPSGPVIYYRHPDGDPAYSSTPKRTEDGRNFVAVLASEDVSFEIRPEMKAGGGEATGPSDRKILYYRDPMGLPDMTEVARPLRFLNLLFGLWLIAAPWLLAGGTAGSTWNDLVIGLAVTGLSRPRGRRSKEHYRSMDRYVV
jgi:hypothetical protein